MNVAKPIIKTKLQHGVFKVLEIIGKAGDEISAHKVNKDALLQLLSGSVIYVEGKNKIELCEKTIHPIPGGQVHTLRFSEEAKLHLILVTETKMSFVKK